MDCPRCGTRLTEEARFCTQCGAPVPHGEKRRTKRRALVLVLVFVVFALLLAGGVAFAAYQASVNAVAPQQMVEQAGDEPAAPEEPSPESLTYGVEMTSIDVSVMGDPYYAPGTRTGTTWEYPVITASGANDAVDRINADVAALFEEAAARMEAQDSSTYGTDSDGTLTILANRADVTYLSYPVCCIAERSHETAWGPHGSNFVSTRCYSLETGEQISVAEAAGISEDELAAHAEAAVRAFVEREGSDLYDTDTAVEGALAGTYYLADEGVVLSTPDYGLGSYAYGTREIVVYAFGGPALEGTSIGHTHPFGPIG